MHEPHLSGVRAYLWALFPSNGDVFYVTSIRESQMQAAMKKNRFGDIW